MLHPLRPIYQRRTEMNEKYYGTELAYKNGYEEGTKTQLDYTFSKEVLTEMKVKGMTEKQYLNFLLEERTKFLSAKIAKR